MVKPDMESFILHLSKYPIKDLRYKIFIYSIARLARAFPRHNPREFLLEWIMDRIHEHELYLRDLNRKEIYDPDRFGKP